MRRHHDGRAAGRATGWERVLGWLSAILIIAAIGTVVFNRWQKRPADSATATQSVLPDLKASPQIELAVGVLQDWNVLLVSLDTTRANHLNCYGYPFTKTPVMNSLARQGVLYSHAFTPSPATLPAHASLLTGLYPLHHGARANGTFTLAEDNVTLAELLSAQGYRTGAAISAFVLDSRFGTDQGFETYHDDLTVGMKHSPHMFRERAAELTNVPTREWLLENGHEKFFFWVHYFDPHAPYAPPEPYRTQYAEGPYDGEIDYVDEQLGKLLDVLDELGVRDRTLVVVVSDHGEGLGQHGEQTHSLLVYDSTLHVPMIFSAPHPFPQGRVVHGQVCLTDVMPTVLELLGLAVPPDLDGVSLLNEVHGLRPTICIETLASMVMHGWAPLIGLRGDDYKFILAPEKEIYDLRQDPLEESNMHADRPKLAKALYQQLVDLVGTADPYLATAVENDLQMDEETRRRLESLGYIGSGSAEEDAAPEALPDPKKMVHHWERVQHGVHLKLGGDVKGAVKILEDAVQKVPRDKYALQNLAGCYAMMGDREKALATIEPALEFGIQDNAMRLFKAGLQLGRGQIKEAEEIFTEFHEADPENTEALLGLARIAYLRGNAEAAMEMLEEIIRINPGSDGPIAFNQIGRIHLLAGRYGEAREAFESALEIDGLNGRAHDGLTNVLIAEDNYDEAMRHLQLGIRFSPLQLGAIATLGGLFREKGNLRLGAAWCRKALSINPSFPDALNNLGLIYQDQDQLEQAEDTYRKAIEAAPRMATPRLNLAQLLLDKGDETAAGEQLLAAVRVNPNDVFALANFGTYAYRRGRLEEAAGLYQRAVRLKPDYALAHKYLGQIYASVERPKASVRHLELALEHDPEDVEVEQIRELIGKMRKIIQADPEKEETPFRTRRRLPQNKSEPSSNAEEASSPAVRE